MKFLFDFFPIIVFYIAYKTYDIFVATGVAIVATAIQVSIFWMKHRRVEKIHVITLALIVVLGGATLWFHDPVFIKWKVSIVNWLFALVFLGSQFVGERNLVERMMGGNVQVAKPIWVRLNISWVVFFIAVGFINLFVFTHYDEATWVDFKVYGLMGLTLLFVIAQALYLTRHLEPVNESEKES